MGCFPKPTKIPLNNDFIFDFNMPSLFKSNWYILYDKA